MCYNLEEVEEMVHEKNIFRCGSSFYRDREFKKIEKILDNLLKEDVVECWFYSCKWEIMKHAVKVITQMWSVYAVRHRRYLSL